MEKLLSELSRPGQHGYSAPEIDVVEIDPEVVAVAKKFFAFREDAAMHAYVKDGRRFIEECRDPYDVIFLDAYGPDSIPYALSTREFLHAVRRALTPKGIAVANVWSRSSNPLYDSMVRTYQDVFEHLAILDVQGSENKIFLAMPRQRQIPQDELARRARKISREKGFRYDLGDVVTYGYREAGKKDPGARVLTDKNEKEDTGKRYRETDAGDLRSNLERGLTEEEKEKREKGKVGKVISGSHAERGNRWPMIR